MSKATIQGMSCAHCAETVTGALKTLNLSDIKVDFKKGTASFKGETNEGALKAAIDEAGYTLVSYQGA